MATAKYLTDPPQVPPTEAKKNWEKNTNKASVWLNGAIRRAISNDERLPGRRRLDSAKFNM